MTPLTIEKISAFPVLAPLEEPIRTASVSIPKAPLIVINLQTKEGVRGSSYVFAYTPLVLRALTHLIRDMGETLIGRPAAPLDVFEDMEQQFRLLGRQGLVAMSLAGIDLALWDVQGLSQNQPVATLLGASPRAIRCYDSLGVFQTGRDEAMIERSLDRGFSALKVKLAGGSAGSDLADLRALRRIVGPDTELMIDYNQSLTAPDAIRRIRTFEDAGIDLTWIEEPVSAEDFAGHKAVRAAVSTPIQTGENWWLPQDAARALQAGICDEAMLDMVKIGGLTGWMRGVALARAASVPVSSHLFVEASAHAMAATPMHHYLEYLDIAGGLLETPLPARDGFVTAQGPGLGLTWNEDAINAHLAQ